MKLSAGSKPDVVDPTPDQVVEAIRSLPGGIDSFVVLSRSDHQFLQTAGSAQEGFRLEYKELTDAEPNVATTEDITEERLIKTFLAYLRGDDSWKHEYQWTELSGSSGCSGAVASVLLTILVAFVIAS